MPDLLRFSGAAVGERGAMRRGDPVSWDCVRCLLRNTSADILNGRKARAVMVTLDGCMPFPGL